MCEGKTVAVPAWCCGAAFLHQEYGKQLRADVEMDGVKYTTLKTKDYFSEVLIDELSLWQIDNFTLALNCCNDSQMKKNLFFICSSQSLEELPASCEWHCLSCRRRWSWKTCRIKDWAWCTFKHVGSGMLLSIWIKTNNHTADAVVL